MSVFQDRQCFFFCFFFFFLWSYFHLCNFSDKYNLSKVLCIFLQNPLFVKWQTKTFYCFPFILSDFDLTISPISHAEFYRQPWNNFMNLSKWINQNLHGKNWIIQNSSYLCSPDVFIKLTGPSMVNSPLKKWRVKLAECELTSQNWWWCMVLSVRNVSVQQLFLHKESVMACLYLTGFCFFLFLCGIFLGLSSPLVSLSPDQAAGAWPLSSAPSNGALFRHSPSSSTRNIPFTSRDNFIHLVHHCIQLNEENYVDTLLNWISMCGLEKGRFFVGGVSMFLFRVKERNEET